MIPPEKSAAPTAEHARPSDSASSGGLATDTLESLDEELASLADEMVSGQFVADPPVAAPVVDVDHVKAVPTAAIKPAAAPPTGQPAPPSAVAAPKSSTPVASATAGTPDTPDAPTTVEPASSVATSPEGPSIGLVHRSLILISRPLEGTSDIARSCIGAAAICQIVLAGVVVFYSFFIRSPEAPVPTVSDVSLRERAAPPSHDAHSKSSAPKKDAGHGKPAPKKDAGHGKPASKKDAGHGKPAKGGH